MKPVEYHCFIAHMQALNANITSPPPSAGLEGAHVIKKRFTAAKVLELGHRKQVVKDLKGAGCKGGTRKGACSGHGRVAERSRWMTGS